MPVLGHLLVEASAGTVRLTATDLDLPISTTIDAEVDREGSTPAIRGTSRRRN
jgi:DNA polymerase III sliding clamp (beta) subunit (PCNA family)